MPRLMSVAYTEAAVRARVKTVTRRIGWRFLAPGDRLTLVRKSMGRKPGEPLVRICDVQVVNVRRESLADGIDPDVETRHDGAVANLAAAGLLAVAASPAAPQAADEAERWKQAYALKLAEFTRETLRVSAALRICNDRYRTGSGEGGLGYSMAQDDVRKAIESVPAVPASSTPAPADDEAALVERMAAAIAKDDGFDWRSGEWNDVYLSRARAVLAELKRGQKA